MSRSWLAIAGVLACGLIAAIIATSGTPGASAASRSPGAPDQAALVRPPRSGGPVMSETGTSGLQFRLSEGAAEASEAAAPREVESTPLDEASTRALLARVPPLAAEPAPESPFALREASLPPPRTGRTIAGTFPPASGVAPPDPASSGPLAVVRHAPDGDVPLAPHVSVTFSQPMVAVTSHDDLARAPVPVTIEPQPPGSWRWVGTKTALFESTPRLPMATDYTVEVPAGTRSAIGTTLASAERWSFSTPAPTIVSSHPRGGPVRLDPILFVAFDQQVNATAVLATIRVSAGSATPRLRLATPGEVDADPAVKRLAAGAEPGRWLAFRSEERLPPDAAVTVTVGPGTPSAEGPKKTTAPQTWEFRTYDALSLTRHRCGWGGDCRPLMPWTIEFSNPIDADLFSDAMVRIDPPLPSMKIDVSGAGLLIRGESKGRTSYRVTIGAPITDVFGQTLGRDHEVTFEVGSAEPSLFSQGGNFVALDPAAGPRFPVYSVNHPSLGVELHAVEPGDWEAFQEALQKSWSEEGPITLPGRRAWSGIVRVAGEADTLTETAIDLRPAMPDGLGQAVLLVEPDEARPSARRRQPRILVWVQATRLGLDAFADDIDLVAWVSSLENGAPLPGVQVSFLADTEPVVTDATGLARLPLSGKPASLLVARSGRDIAILPRTIGWARDGSWGPARSADALRWYVFDDRQMYRPGEEVQLKGWIRKVGSGTSGDVMPLGDAVNRVSWKVLDSRGNEIGQGSTRPNAFGGFDLTIALPPTVNLGPTHVAFAAVDHTVPVAMTDYAHTFQVQEFRRPEFEVSASASEGPHVVRQHATLTVSASYYAGGALPGAEVQWRVTASPGSFTPPGRSDYSFGFWTPWWEAPPYPGRTTEPVVHEARTDTSGRHLLRIDFDAVTPARPSTLRAEATVVDVNRQAWTDGVDLLVHPALAYVGLKTDRYFVQRGDPLAVDLIVVDLDGRMVPGLPVVVRVERLDWRQVRGDWREQIADTQECTVASGTDVSRCVFKTPEGGTYRIVATVTDGGGRPNATHLRRWVAGGRVPPQRNVVQERVTLVPDKETYRRGDAAEILVIPPFSPAEGVLTLRRSGLVRTERFTIRGTSHTLRIPIEEAWTPNVHVQVDLSGSAPRTTDAGAPAPDLPPRPAFASGALNLPVPPVERTLALDVAPRDRALEPGVRTAVELTLRDSAGRPVAGGEAAVVVVDEAVLSLTGYRLPDPVKVFYSQRGANVWDHRLRRFVLLGRPEDLAAGVGGERQMALTEAVQVMAAPPPPGAPVRVAGQAGQVGGLVGSLDEAPPVRMRADFSALALFAASVPTDAEGRASVEVTLPDTLTRYRVMAVAATSGASFGSGESTITARLPLMVRPSPPRFLNLGDRAELPIVLQNQTDAPLTVDVAVQAVNAVLDAEHGRRVSVPASDRVEVRFPARAARPGSARFQAVAASGRWADASRFTLPVWTPATTEAFATYGQIDEGAIILPVSPPGEAFTEFGGLEVTTSSTGLQALTDAVVYLASYPFDCAEQLASRLLALAAVRDVLAAFGASGLPAPADLQSAVERDLARLVALQNDDGGFGLWWRGDESWPYVSIHVAHAFERAREKGFDLNQRARDRSAAYLKAIEQHIPANYSVEARRALIAYALYVRRLAGDRDAARARRLIAEAGLRSLSVEAVGWLLSVVHDDPGSRAEVAAMRTLLGNQVTETAAAAHFVVSYADSAYLLFASNRRADAVVLEAMIADQPQHDLIPKLVEGLLAHRVAGRWENTQENVFVLLALDRYFRTYEKVTPDFVARVWLGDRYAGEHPFRGRSTDRHLVTVPMALLAESGDRRLVVDKDGPGRLYYRVGLKYAPQSFELLPLDRGFTVERTYQAVDRPDDVRREADGSWRIRAGARVRVQLSLVAPSRRYHVALVDPLPAGLEAENPALATTSTFPAATSGTRVTTVGAPGLGGPGQPGRYWFWMRPWFEHQNLRDERVEAFTSLLWEGVYTYTYLARATTPGRFVVPPPRAEEMYYPETFGRGGTDTVVVGR